MDAITGDADLDMGREVLPYSAASWGNRENSALDSGAMNVATAAGTQDLVVTFSGIRNDNVWPKQAAAANAAGTVLDMDTDSGVLATGVVQLYYPKESDPALFVQVSRQWNAGVHGQIRVNGAFVDDGNPSNNVWVQDWNAIYTNGGSSPRFEIFDAGGQNVSNAEKAGRGDLFHFACFAGSSTNGVATRHQDFLLKYDNSILEPATDVKDILPGLNLNGSSSYQDVIRNGVSNVTGYTVKAYYLADVGINDNGADMYAKQRFDSLAAARAAGVEPNALYVEVRSIDNVATYNYTNPFAIVPFRVRSDAPQTPFTPIADYTTCWNYVQLEARLYTTDVRGKTLAGYASRTDVPMAYLVFQRSDYSTSVARGLVSPHVYYSPGRDNAGNFTGSGTTQTIFGWDLPVYSGVTFIVVSERATLGKEVSQADASGNTRKVFFVDGGERAVDFAMSPRLSLAGLSTAPQYSTVTVTDTLPKGLSYVAGSSTLGGTYVQPPDRVSHGTVIGGAALVDGGTASGVATSATTTGDVTFTVTPKADGTTELKWVITNVQAGQEMPKIRYRATIGDESDPTQDVADGDQLVNSAQITSTNDVREISPANGNVATATVTIQKLGSGTLMKRISTPETDLDEDIIYTIDYINDSEHTLGSMNILDLLPYNGDLRGSIIHGSYTVDTVTVEQLNDAAGSYAMDYTTDTSVHGHENDLFSIAPAYTAASASVAGKVTTLKLPAGMRPTLLNIKGTNVGGYAKVRITITLHPTGNKDGDTYGNDAGYNTPTIPAPVYAASVYATVVQEKATLTIAKTVMGTGTDSFPFEVLFADKNGDPVRIPDDTQNPKRYTVASISPYKVTFSLKHGEQVVLKAIPVGSSATITETNHNGYMVLIKDTTAGGTTLSNTDTATVAVTTDKAVEVVNNPGVILPSTGGSGIYVYLFGGLAVYAAMVRYILPRREREGGQR